MLSKILSSLNLASYAGKDHRIQVDFSPFWVMPLIVLLAIGAPLLVTFFFVSPKPPEMPSELQASIDKSIDRHMVALAVQCGKTKPTVMLVPPVPGDRTQYITGELRGRVAEAGLAIQPGESAGERWRKFFGFAPPTPADEHEAAAWGRDAGADAVLFARVLALYSDTGGGRAELELKLLDLKGNVVHDIEPVLGTVQAPRDFSQAGLVRGIFSGGLVSRLAVWLVVVLGIPLLLFRRFRRQSREHSNVRNLAKLFVFTGSSAVLGLALFGLPESPWTGALLLMLLLVIPLFYLAWTMTFAARLERA